MSDVSPSNIRMITIIREVVGLSQAFVSQKSSCLITEEKGWGGGRGKRVILGYFMGRGLPRANPIR